MKRFILVAFFFSLIASCLTEVKEKEKTPNYSSFIISFVHRDSFTFEGFDSERQAYIKTAPDSVLTKQILDRYPYNITETFKVPCFYEYFDSATTGVKAIQFERKITKLF